MDAKKKTVIWIYAGQRVTVDGKTSDLYYSKSNTTKPLLFGTQGKKVIGGLYQGEVSTDKQIAYDLPTWKYLGESNTEEDTVTTWAALTVAAKERVKYLKMHRKALKHDPIYECLTPLIDAYKNTNSVGKQAIISKVLYSITRGA